MEESILTSVKNLLGITEDCTDFDVQIIVHINSVFMALTQLGVGPSDGFIIEDDMAVWEDYIPDRTKFQAVKSYIGLRVRLLFDPPTSSAVMEAYKSQIAEYEFRLNLDAESV